MNRREFIQRAALLSAYALSRSAVPARADAAGEPVIIIGAGIAGLGAARTLHILGFKAIVLEARDRIGGRIWTSRLWKKLSLDLGATWIRGIKSNPIAELAHEFKATTLPTSPNNIALYNPDGRLLDETEKSRVFARAANALKRRIDHLPEEKPLVTREKRELSFALNFLVENKYGANFEDLSSLYWKDSDRFLGDDVFFPDGFDQITDGLATGLDIRLNHAVTHIEWSDAGVTVATGSELFKASRVIVTLPLGVLQGSSVAFSPALPPAFAAAMSRMKMGTQNKCYLRFGETFWEEDDHWIGHISDRPGEWTGFLNLYPTLRRSILMGLNSGAYGKFIESQTDEEIVGSAMNVLRKIYGPAIPEPESALITRWAADPFSLGSHSFLGTGATADDWTALAKPISSRLFLAGEHTSHYAGTVHGAYLSGLRAANKIAALPK